MYLNIYIQLRILSNLTKMYMCICIFSKYSFTSNNIFDLIMSFLCEEVIFVTVLIEIQPVRATVKSKPQKNRNLSADVLRPRGL